MKQMMNAPPGNCTEKEKVLWQKIQDFQFDEPDAALPFSRKLALQQRWDYDFTLGAIEEYRKFIFLCCTTPHGASPSKVIDEVWHLHLIYTENYWEAFCEHTLKRKLHHHPSSGGPVQKEKFQQWQDDTLQNYRSVFGSEPPQVYWNDKLVPGQAKQTLFKTIVKKIVQSTFFLPLLLLTGCDGGSILGLILIPVMLLTYAIQKSVAGKSPEDLDPKKKDQSGGCSSSGCGSSCGGGGCGGGCGGCGS